VYSVVVGQSDFHRQCVEAPEQLMMSQQQNPNRVTNSKPIPHIPLPFKEVIADVLKVIVSRRREIVMLYER
jgi:hypothetical protein